MSNPTSATFVTAEGSALTTLSAATETAATAIITESGTNAMQSSMQDSTVGIAVTMHQTPGIDRSTQRLTGERKRNKKT